ncbi:hypothetical protein OIU85_000810 [Salix viminalis]|uniref:Mitochondrial substrate carrier family protein n=1 Tax=Salix viminalis TaxID=40686 RepID=A0A9Q0ZX47_SALVM|nr:hypothetical protein OIU85_000810 [Salix viminalis]
MNIEARVGVVLEGGQRALNSASIHGSIMDAGARKFLQQHNNKQGQQHSQSGTVQKLLAGGIAGAFSKTCTAPMARLTILFQVQVTIAHRLPYSSLSFFAYECYKSFLQPVFGVENHRANGTADVAVHFIGGGMAGITAASATYPLDLVRMHIAAQTQLLLKLAENTIEEGFLGLYKGLGATLLGVGPSIAISFSVYESLRSFWHSKRPNDATVMVSLACGSLSGIASSTATFPLDPVRRRMQLEGVVVEHLSTHLACLEPLPI